MSDEQIPIAVELVGAKAWWQSRTVIGALVVIVAQIARFAGVEIDSVAVTDALLQGIELAGAALALWGRVRASQPVRFRAAKPGPADPAPAVPDWRERMRGHPVEPMQANGGQRAGGYWGSRRGPLDDD